MLPHPEDLYRAQRQLHAEMIRNHALARQARAAHRPARRFREIGRDISGFVDPMRWWKGITSLVNRSSKKDGTSTIMLPTDVQPITAPITFPLDSPALHSSIR